MSVETLLRLWGQIVSIEWSQQLVEEKKATCTEGSGKVPGGGGDTEALPVLPQLSHGMSGHYQELKLVLLKSQGTCRCSEQVHLESQAP